MQALDMLLIILTSDDYIIQYSTSLGSGHLTFCRWSAGIMQAQLPPQMVV